MTVDEVDPVDVVKGTGADASEGDLVELVKGRVSPVREERFEIVPKTKLEREDEVVDEGERVEPESEETHVDEADPGRDSEQDKEDDKEEELDEAEDKEEEGDKVSDLDDDEEAERCGCRGTCC